MGVHRRGFALVLVLVAVASVFALAMRGAVALRTATVEAGAWRDRQAMRRDATTASVRAMLGLTAGDAGGVAASGGSSESGAQQRQPQVDVDDPDIPEMPVEMEEFLRGLLDEDDDEQNGEGLTGAGDGGDGDRGASAGRGGGRYSALRRVGFPDEPVEVDVGGRVYNVRFADAAGVINLNEAGEEQLSRYFKRVADSDLLGLSLAHEALDWRDEDNVPRSYGAERESYLRRDVQIRNGDFKTVEELLYLPSMTRSLFERIRDNVTVLGDETIHAGSAPRDVLLSVPAMTEPSADRILALRREGRLTRQTLTEAVSALASDAMPMLRTKPSVFVRVRVEPAGPAPTFEGLAIVSDSRGVQAMQLRTR